METVIILTSIIEGMRAPVAVHATAPRGNLGAEIGGSLMVDWLRERYALPAPEYPRIPPVPKNSPGLARAYWENRIELPAAWRGEFEEDWAAAKAAAGAAFDAAFAVSGIRTANAVYEEERDRALMVGARARRNQEDMSVTKTTLWRVKTRPYVRA